MTTATAVPVSRTGRDRDVLGPTRVGEIEDLGAADERDPGEKGGDAEIACGRLHLTPQLLHELACRRRHDPTRVLGERDGAQAVDRRHSSRSVLGVDAVEAGLRHQLQRFGLESEYPSRRLETGFVAGRLAVRRAGLQRHGAGRDRSQHTLPRVESCLDGHGRRRCPGGHAGMLGFESQLDCGAVARPVARHLGADERDRGADRRQHLGMLGADQRTLQALRHERNERLTSAAQRNERHVPPEVVVARGIGDRFDDLLDRSIEQPLGGARRRRLQPLGERGECRQSRLLARERVRSRGDEAESIGRAGGGQRVELATCPDAGVQLRIALTWGDELELCADELRRIGEAGVGKAGDVRASRPRLVDRAPLEERHAAPGCAHDPAVDCADARRPAHDPQRADDRPAALDDRDVRARAAALDDDRVRQAELVQGSRDARRRA